MKIYIDSEVCWQRIEGQVYITKGETYLLLNKTASAVWVGIFERKNIENITSCLQMQYGIHRDEALADVTEIIEDLVGWGVLTYEKPKYN